MTFVGIYNLHVSGNYGAFHIQHILKGFNWEMNDNTLKILQDPLKK